ncbi:NPCBM/NEW2 domain-containing protein [Caloramator quimbayensis]|uniref:NPCBM/NEW2 domain-containing protein n=1 Tax=Caloramator quimbayensis TaxID=1147123 RepID=A0A1T4WKT7_9CLOT|nr:NPCBM/NEW2 domain-containing protein [Caloramator quimbayensis]SKA77950.1 NPCBM/NEW2 domain-containing protein [Caloramator quimbayensis]
MNFKSKTKYIIIGFICGLILSSTVVFAAPAKITAVFSSVKLYYENTLKSSFSIIKYGNENYVPWSKVAPYLKESVIFNGTDMKIKSPVSQFNAKLVIDGTERPSAYNDGINNIPSLILYQNNVYTPINYIANNMDKTIQYKSQEKTFYVGKIPEGQYMSDILKPFNVQDGKCYINEDLKLAGKDYFKGYHLFTFYNSSVFSFNLEGKYSDLSGLIGACNYAKYNNDATVEIYGDDNLLAKYEITPDNLPQNINLNVTGVLKLTIKVRNKDVYSSYIDLCDLIIK